MQRSILLAEHDESVRKMVGRVLASAGYAVTQAGSSAEAATGWRAAPPDLVVWDLEMPAPEGKEELGFKEPARHAVPVIGMTAWPNQDDKAARRGVSALLEKPLDLGLLLRTIRDLLAAQEQRNATPHAATT